ncbi:MAG: hypothetical protein O3C63_07585 [Cyanobacteria bacterium]|nr:hypothetical protein [Cyanobacteriota bacterium]MDA1020737.1 hypothetical protein [Cyanobacteriota bacterium]
MRKFVPLLVVVLFVCSLQPAKSFLDFEDFLIPFKKHHRQTVHVINHVDAPVLIVEARVDDRGSNHFKTFTGILDTYHLKVQNVSGKKILAYRIAWTLKHPFQDWVYRTIEANSIDLFMPGALQKVSFKRDKHYRQDAYYYAEISKVEFDDETIWKAPEHDETMTAEDIIQQEIDAIEEKSIDDLSIDELKELVPQVNGAVFESQPITEPGHDQPSVEEVAPEDITVE